MTAPLLEVEDLKVHFPIRARGFKGGAGTLKAVDGVSFTMGRGECLGLVGESGCGKTTTGQAIIRLTEPTAGTVRFDGQDVGTMDKRQRFDLCRRMQIIFQDPYSSLNPRMTVNDALAAPMRIHKLYPGRERPERVAFLLEKVGLKPEQGTRYPHEFSGGQRQRIAIARALALDPMLVVGDEPVSALDVSIQAQIVNLLMDLQKEFGLSLLIVAHDLAVIEHLCDRIAVMYLGRIVELGTYKEIYGNPRHPYTQALLSAIPVPDPDRPRSRIVLTGDLPSPMNPPPGCAFNTRCPKATDLCRQERPVLTQDAAGHQVACHYA